MKKINMRIGGDDVLLQHLSAMKAKLGDDCAIQGRGRGKILVKDLDDEEVRAQWVAANPTGKIYMVVIPPGGIGALHVYTFKRYRSCREWDRVEMVEDEAGTISQ